MFVNHFTADWSFIGSDDWIICLKQALNPNQRVVVIKKFSQRRKAFQEKIFYQMFRDGIVRFLCSHLNEHKNILCQIDIFCPEQRYAER